MHIMSYPEVHEGKLGKRVEHKRGSGLLQELFPDIKSRQKGILKTAAE